MTPRRWLIDVDRVIVVGTTTRGLDAGELRSAVSEALGTALRDAPLPSGRAVRGSVVMEGGAPRSGGAAALGSAVAGAVTLAVGGGGSHG